MSAITYPPRMKMFEAVPPSPEPMAAPPPLLEELDFAVTVPPDMTMLFASPFAPETMPAPPIPKVTKP